MDVPFPRWTSLIRRDHKQAVPIIQFNKPSLLLFSLSIWHVLWYDLRDWLGVNNPIIYLGAQSLHMMSDQRWKSKYTGCLWRPNCHFGEATLSRGRTFPDKCVLCSGCTCPTVRTLVSLIWLRPEHMFQMLASALQALLEFLVVFLLLACNVRLNRTVNGCCQLLLFLSVPSPADKYIYIYSC